MGSFSVVGLSGSANWLNLVEVGVVAAGVAAVEGLRDLHTEELEVVLILPEVAEGEQLLQVLLYLLPDGWIGDTHQVVNVEANGALQIRAEKEEQAGIQGVLDETQRGETPGCLNKPCPRCVAETIDRLFGPHEYPGVSDAQKLAGIRGQSDP